MVRAWSNIFVMWYITFVLKGIYLWALTMTNKVYFAKKKKNSNVQLRWDISKVIND